MAPHERLGEIDFLSRPRAARGEAEASRGGRLDQATGSHAGACGEPTTPKAGLEMRRRRSNALKKAGGNYVLGRPEESPAPLLRAQDVLRIKRRTAGRSKARTSRDQKSRREATAPAQNTHDVLKPVATVNLNKNSLPRCPVPFFGAATCRSRRVGAASCERADDAASRTKRFPRDDGAPRAVVLLGLVPRADGGGHLRDDVLGYGGDHFRLGLLDAARARPDPEARRLRRLLGRGARVPRPGSE